MQRLPAVSTPPPCSPLVELFLTTREEANCEPGYLREYRRVLARFFEAPGVPQDPRELSGDSVTFFMAHLRRQGTGASGRETYQRRILTFLRWLYDRGDIARNPKQGLVRVQVPRTLQPQVDIDTITALVGALEHRPRTAKGNRITAENRLRNIAILRLFWATGLRRGELCALRLEDVDLDNRLLLVRYAKGKKQRRVPFDLAAKRALLEYIAGERGRNDATAITAGTPRDGNLGLGERDLSAPVSSERHQPPKTSNRNQPRFQRLAVTTNVDSHPFTGVVPPAADDSPLFLSRTGGALTPDGLSQWMARLAARAGVTAPTHAFRRGFARRTRRDGMDLGETARLMGHETLTMTMRYSQEGEAEAATAAYRKLYG